jgi:hypothetical protein
MSNQKFEDFITDELEIIDEDTNNNYIGGLSQMEIDAAMVKHSDKMAEISEKAKRDNRHLSYIADPKKYKEAIIKEKNDIDSINWGHLISIDKSLLKHCPDNIMKDFASFEIKEILSQHPHMYDKFNVTKLTNSHLCELVCRQPIFSKIVNWDKIENGHIVRILIMQPQLVYECSHKLNEFEIDDFVSLLVVWPGFYRHFDLKEMEERHWNRICKANPAFTKFKKLNQI